MDKRKHSSDSGETTDAKNARGGDSPVNVYDTIREANSVLLDNSVHELYTNIPGGAQTIGDSDGQGLISRDNGAAGTGEVINTDINKTEQNSSVFGAVDIMVFLEKIDGRLDTFEKKLDKLDVLESKVCGIDSDVKTLWVHVHDSLKSCDNKVDKCIDQVEQLQVALSQAHDNISRMSREQSILNNEMEYLRSQSMRNNLVFSNIPESISEKPAETEEAVRSFMVDKMGLQQSTVDQIPIERGHRAGPSVVETSGAESGKGGNSDGGTCPYGPPRRPRSIFVKFASFKDRELVRKSSYRLKGTSFYVNEQFPKSVSDRRRALIPRLKAAQRNGQRAWLSYYKLYVDGLLQQLGEGSQVHQSGVSATTGTSAQGSATGSGGDVEQSSQIGAGGHPGGRDQGRSGRGRGGRGSRRGNRGRGSRH